MTAVHETGSVNAGVSGAGTHGVRGRMGGVGSHAVATHDVATAPTGFPPGTGASGAPRRALRPAREAGGAPSARPGAPGRSPRVITPALQAMETAEAATQGRSGWVAPARQARGVAVCGPDGTYIGVLKEINSHGALVERSVQRAVYVPFEAIATVRDEQLTLAVAADQVDRMLWQHPD